MDKKLGSDFKEFKEAKVQSKKSLYNQSQMYSKYKFPN